MINISDITFIITTFRSRSTIFNCLDSIPGEINKIVLENSQDNELKLVLEKQYSNLKCYIMDQNYGYGKANNFGINKSQTPYIFILNPDVILVDDFLKIFLKKIEHKEFSIAAPLEKNNSINYQFDNNGVVNVKFVKGFALLINKKLVTRYFDENFFLYLEEIDLCKNIIDSGGKIILIDLKVNHLGGNSHGDRDDFEMEKSRNWHWMWSKFYYNQKHYGYIFSFFKNFPTLVLILLKFLFYKIIKKKNKKIIYYMRMMGLINSYLLRNSYYRPYDKIK